MTSPDYRLLHRIVRTDPPTRDDIVSDKERGLPAPDDPVRRALWGGLST
jgi:hypothetical protein